MPRKNVFGLAIISLGWMASSAVIAQDAEWRVGVTQVKITPEEPLFMAGYQSRNKPFETVHDDLYVKALVLEDRDGTRAVLVTSDLIGFKRDISDPIRGRIQEQTGIPATSVVLNSSHTHSGPTLSLEPLPRDDRAADDQARTVAYTRQLQDKIVAAVSNAAGKMRPAKLSWGVGVVNFVMNRREFTIERGVILGVNPRGMADRSVPVLRIDDSDGKLLAVVFGTACHNTTPGSRNYEISGDFAGLAQRLVAEKHSGAETLFVQGCGGDANPYPRDSFDDVQDHGEELANEVNRVLQTELSPVQGPLKIAFGEVNLPLAPTLTIEEFENEISSTRSSAVRAQLQGTLQKLKRGEALPTEYAVPLAVWQLGDDLTFVALSGEVVVDYVRLLEQALGPNRLWIAAYCQDVYGYLPSARLLMEGGYETRGLYNAGQFTADAEPALVNKVRDLANEAGRDIPGK